MIEAISKRSIDLQTIQAFKQEVGWSLPLSEVEKLNLIFSNTMKEVYQQYKEDIDIGALYGESLMMLNPWKLWTNDGIITTPNTLLIIEIFDEIFAKLSKK